jgi:hypothetical protein
MGTIIVETFIARPPEQVFEYLRAYANEAKWQSMHVARVIVEPLYNFFAYIRLSPLFYCFVPVFSLGAVTMLVGFFVDKK